VIAEFQRQRQTVKADADAEASDCGGDDDDSDDKSGDNNGENNGDNRGDALTKLASLSLGASSFHAGDPAVPVFMSGIYSDGQIRASWSALPNELQLKILAPIVKIAYPVSIVSHPKLSKVLLPLLLVNKRMYSQARDLYQTNRVVLAHGFDHKGYFRDMRKPHVVNKILKHPKPGFCTYITALNLWFFPESIYRQELLQGPYSWAPLFRYNEYVRLRRECIPSTAALEAESVRRIA
jgi:hypothetical protein